VVIHVRFWAVGVSVAGGLLGAGLVPAGIAGADVYTIGPASGSELVTDFYGLGTNGWQQTPPALATSVDGTQLYNWTDVTTGDSGTFNADVSISTNLQGSTTTEVMVAPGQYGTDAPPVGSVFDTTTNSHNANSSFYSDLKGAGTGGKDVITETSTNAFGTHDVATSYDAASVPQTDTFSLGNGYTIDAADPTSGYDITGINGLPPDDMVDQGSQLFYVEDPSGNVVGSFDALKTTTSDLAGSYTQALLVTQDISGTPGTALGDVPNVGSVYNTFTINGIESIYQDLTPTTAGAKDVVTYGFGSPSNTNGFDASAAPAEGAQQYIPFGTGDHIVPDANFQEVFTGVNGLPPYDVAIQGYQLYDVDDAQGNIIGTFYGDETTTENGYGHINEAIVVTQDVTGTSNDPAVGSVFDTAPHGFGGELVYSDLVGAGSNNSDLIKEVVIGANGATHAVHQTYDFSQLFKGVEFQSYGADSAAADPTSHVGLLADLLHGVDPTALASVDPAAASLDATPLLDMFPHLEAAVNLVTGLF
jgi:hypothetical protein